MSKKGTTNQPQPGPRAEQEPTVQLGRDSAAIAEAVQGSLGGFREDVIDIVRELRLDVDETLGVMRREMADRDRELRQELKLMGDERVRFFRRVEDLLEDALSAGRMSESGMTETAPCEEQAVEELATLDQVEKDDWLAAQQEAEQAVAGGPPVEVEGLDGKDPVQEAEAAIQACMETVMTSGGSHVEKVFRQVHGFVATPANNA